ncbi:MAG: hypothetical protein CMP50_05415 [Flavobacteriales bacterium]|nr:hypothetical protein [Flavobacteriales bacterium]|tara:strand:+ start:16125 stop:16922 length:798 start_codon:yes stop_codon:yes gene_type:complete
MKQLIALLLLSTIGFSQDGENSILDELLISDEVNGYFQLALSLNVDNLSFLNNCDDTTSYLVFAPGNNVPTSSVSTLLGLDGDAIDYILYYVTIPNDDEDTVLSTLCADVILSGGIGTCEPYVMNMIDGNTAELTYTIDITAGDGFDAITVASINDVNISNYPEGIPACNGSIYIINDLIWAPGIGLEENSSFMSIYPNPAKDVLNVSKIAEIGVLELIDMSGKVLLSQEINNDTQIHTSNYKKGIYLISFTSKNQRFTQLLSIN